jgi:polyisoprenoid-binding protein YceI
MNFRPAVLPLLALLAASNAVAGDWDVQPELSALRFSGVSQGESFEGRFTRFTPQIRFDPADLAHARFDVAIDHASGEDFFDLANYPAARFVATEFVAAGAAFEAHGALELRGTRQPVTLRFQWTPGDGGARLEGEATLDRTAFGVGGGDWADADTIAHEVKVATVLMLVPRP